VIRHAVRAVPWAVIALGIGLVPLLLLIVEHWPYELWPLQGTAVGVLAATTAWCFDEPAAAVVDTLPRHLGWRTAARCGGVLVIVVVWGLALGWTHTGYFGHARDVAWQGVAAVLFTVALVTWRRSRGAATPAKAVAAAVVPIAMFVALVRPFETHLPLFPYTSTGDWAASRVLWSGAAVAALALLLALVNDWPIRQSLPTRQRRYEQTPQNRPTRAVRQARPADQTDSCDATEHGGLDGGGDGAASQLR
jgi:hypothetical protein